MLGALKVLTITVQEGFLFILKVPDYYTASNKQSISWSTAQDEQTIDMHSAMINDRANVDNRNAYHTNTMFKKKCKHVNPHLKAHHMLGSQRCNL